MAIPETVEHAMRDDDSKRPNLHFITGRLAEYALRATVADAAKTLDFEYTVGVMPITVAALMTPRWLLRHIDVPAGTSEVILPGFVGDDSGEIERAVGMPVRVGPRDLRELPEFLGAKKNPPRDLTEQDIEIIAEINDAPRMTVDELIAQAAQLRSAGADRIDVGCVPGIRWSRVGEAVAALTAEGHAVSIDSFDPIEVAQACRAGASLVLSVNSENVHAAKEWEAEVVAIPDTPDDLASLDRTIAQLIADKVTFRIDPILEPIGMGLANSLVRYHTVRHRYGDAAMMMGIGNLTELTDVDSAGINVLLMGICQELRVGSVLTTQVINWARSAVRECDLARRLVHYSVHHRVPPKRIDDALVVLRDPKLRPHPAGTFKYLAETIRDNNYRLYAQDQRLHLVSSGLYLSDRDPFRLFAALLECPESRNVDTSHAFYLGFELCKAMIALQLGKQYDQDQSLRWGHLTKAENHHRLKRTPRKPES